MRFECASIRVSLSVPGFLKLGGTVRAHLRIYFNLHLTGISLVKATLTAPVQPPLPPVGQFFFSALSTEAELEHALLGIINFWNFKCYIFRGLLYVVYDGPLLF